MRQFFAKIIRYLTHRLLTMKRSERKQVKADPEQRHPGPHDNPAADNERHISGSINVRGEIEAKRPPDLTKEHNTEREQDKTSERKRFVVEIATLVLVAIYAGLTLWQACSANTSSKEAVKSNGISRDALVTVQRAFIVFKHFEQFRAKVGSGKQPIFKWQFNPRIENTGSTPATIAIEEFSLDHLPNGEPTEDQFVRGTDHGIFSIGPHVEQDGPTVDIDDVYIIGSMNGTLGPNASIASGRDIYGWGFIAYKDAFSNN
jgi:hypothetical protein